MYVLGAAGAVLAALAITLAFLAMRRRAQRGADERIEHAVAGLNARVSELVGAIERAEAESRRQRVLGEVTATLDVDEVLARTLEAACGLPDVDAALVSVPAAAGGKPLVATLGLSADEAQREAVIAGPCEGRAARSIAIAYRLEVPTAEGGEGLIHGGVAVPLAVDDPPHGHLAVFTRGSGYEFGEETIRELEAIARRAGPALDNARRFREARKLADLDALTGLHNRRYFHETLGREVARASRYGRKLALLVLDLDDFKGVNDRIGHLAGDAVLAGAAERIRDVVRSADIACRVGGDEFGVILPEADLTDADQLYQRIHDAVSARPIGEAGHVRLSGGVAELRTEDDAVSFFERADEALYRAKNAGKGRIVAAQ
jgi:diguanylate cyclase (GGDEF)-like protein